MANVVTFLLFPYERNGFIDNDVRPLYSCSGFVGSSRAHQNANTNTLEHNQTINFTNSKRTYIRTDTHAHFISSTNPAMSDSSVFYTPAEMHKIILITNGIKKANLPLYKSIIAGIVSGFFVMIGAHGMVSLLSGSETNTKPVYLLSGIVFAVAIMSILILGGELFTSNCLLLITAIARKITFTQVVKNWFIVYFANFAGSIFFSVMLFGTGMYGFSYDDHTAHAATLCKIVHGKVAPPAYQQFFRAVFANFCVCMACMLAAAARSVEGKVLGMVWPIMVFVVSGFEHSIANQGFFALATLVNCPTPHGWYWVNLSVTTPGNIVGAALIGISFYAVSLWRAEDEKDTKHPADEHTAVVAIGAVLPPPPSSSCNQSAVDRYNKYHNANSSMGTHGRHHPEAGQGSPSCQCAALAQRHVGGGVLALAMHKVESQSILDHPYVSSVDVANNNTTNNTYQQNHHHFSNVSPMPSGVTTPVSAQPRGSLSKMTTASLFVQVPSSAAADAFCAANGCTSHYHQAAASPIKKFSNQPSGHECCECGVPKRQADVSAESSHIFVQAPY